MPVTEIVMLSPSFSINGGSWVYPIPSGVPDTTTVPLSIVVPCVIKETIF